jgi:hypothetical protein
MYVGPTAICLSFVQNLLPMQLLFCLMGANDWLQKILQGCHTIANNIAAMLSNQHSTNQKSLVRCYGVQGRGTNLPFTNNTHPTRIQYPSPLYTINTTYSKKTSDADHCPPDKLIRLRNLGVMYVAFALPCTAIGCNTTPISLKRKK